MAALSLAGSTRTVEELAPQEQSKNRFFKNHVKPYPSLPKMDHLATLYDKA